MGRDDQFTTTRWSRVLAARERSDPGSREALAGLCEAYWYPLYAFVRRQGYDADKASDLTQGYFAALMEKDYLDDVRPERGKFRSFLLASLKHHVSHERERERAAKRGGPAPPISLDREIAERRYRDEPRDDATPETLYERRWAWTVIDRAQARLRLEMQLAGKGERFEHLAGFVFGGGSDRSYRDVAAESGISEAAIAMAVRRLRQRLGDLMRQEIADTVGDPRDVDEEIRHLLTVVRTG